MVNTKAFWSGNCPLSNIIFQTDRFLESFDNELLDRIEKIWIEFKQKYPESYDGKLVLLHDFEFDEDLTGTDSFLLFDTSIIQFSVVTGLRKLGLPIQNYGIMGTQVIVFNQTKEYVLVGRRKFEQDYSPGLLTVPGGVLEGGDRINPVRSLLRELHEEAGVKVKKAECIAVLAEHTGYSSILLITAVLDQEFHKESIIKEKENEFDKNELFWLEIKQLQSIDEKELMEGLTYLQKEFNLNVHGKQLIN